MSFQGYTQSGQTADTYLNIKNQQSQQLQQSLYTTINAFKDRKKRKKRDEIFNKYLYPNADIDWDGQSLQQDITALMNLGFEHEAAELLRRSEFGQNLDQKQWAAIEEVKSAIRGDMANVLTDILELGGQSPQQDEQLKAHLRRTLAQRMERVQTMDRDGNLEAEASLAVASFDGLLNRLGVNEEGPFSPEQMFEAKLALSNITYGQISGEDRSGIERAREEGKIEVAVDDHLTENDRKLKLWDTIYAKALESFKQAGRLKLAELRHELDSLSANVEFVNEARLKRLQAKLDSGIDADEFLDELYLIRERDRLEEPDREIERDKLEQGEDKIEIDRERVRQGDERNLLLAQQNEIRALQFQLKIMQWRQKAEVAGLEEEIGMSIEELTMAMARQKLANPDQSWAYIYASQLENMGMRPIDFQRRFGSKAISEGEVEETLSTEAQRLIDAKAVTDEIPEESSEGGEQSSGYEDIDSLLSGDEEPDETDAMLEELREIMSVTT